MSFVEQINQILNSLGFVSLHESQVVYTIIGVLLIFFISSIVRSLVMYFNGSNEIIDNQKKVIQLLESIEEIILESHDYYENIDDRIAAQNQLLENAQNTLNYIEENTDDLSRAWR